ncbi:hypothetical protein ABRP78_09770 [Corynebacterium sp. KPL4064]|uniref:hypothetical protein n=1 Tax=Corynebacterium sp. KPL4064 TaxID=3158329 RepID=UPI0032EE952D
MPNPTRQEIIDAHEALDCLTYLAESFALSVSGDRDDIKKLQQTTLAALPTKPQPTMAEIEWDDEKHYLAEADHVDWGTVIMLYHDETMRRIQYLCTGEANRACFSTPDALTPTGKRYTLTEVQE